YHVAAPVPSQLDRRSATGLDSVVAVPAMTSIERLAYADDVAAATSRGELAVGDALGVVAQLGKGEPLAQLAALQIVEQLDVIIDDATRPAWTKWVAARFASRLGKAMFAPKTGVERELRDRLAVIV